MTLFAGGASSRRANANAVELDARRASAFKARALADPVPCRRRLFRGRHHRRCVRRRARHDRDPRIRRLIDAGYQGERGDGVAVMVKRRNLG
jgi:hypothetical protein